MLSTELINLHNMMFATISPVTFFASTLSKMITLEAFTKHKNLVLETPSLVTGSHIITDNVQII